MEKRGERLDHTSGETISELMVAGFDPNFEVRPANPPIVDDDGNIWVTECVLLLVPLRRPASRVPHPVGASVHANMPVEGFRIELEKGQSNLRDLYAEKCAKTAAKMIRERCPGVLK